MSPHQVVLDLSSSVPPYEQIRSQITALVAASALRPGDRLPTVRALATDLGVAAGTVARAYRELESEGLVATRRRTGTTIASGAEAADRGVQRAAHAFVAVARTAGLGDGEVIDLVRGALLATPTPARSSSVPASSTARSPEPPTSL